MLRQVFLLPLRIRAHDVSTEPPAAIPGQFLTLKVFRCPLQHELCIAHRGIHIDFQSFNTSGLRSKPSPVAEDEQARFKCRNPLKLAPCQHILTKPPGFSRIIVTG